METQAKQQNKKLLLWGVANAGEGFISIISSTYLAIFLTDVAMLPLGISSAVMLITSIVAFVMASFTGGIIATLKPMKWGKLRSWLLVAPPFAVIGFVLHFSSVQNNPILSAIIITLGYIIGVSAWNFAYAANTSLTNVLAKNQQQRNMFNSQRMMGSNLGRLMGNYLTPVIVAFLAPLVSERASYPILVLIAGAFYILVEYIHFGISKGCEDDYYKPADETHEEEGTVSIKEIFNSIKSNHQLLVTLIIDLTSNMASLALPSLAVYYYRYVFETPSMVSIHMLCIGIAGFAGSTFVRFFGKKVKSYKTFLLCVYVIIALCLFATKLAPNATVFLLINIVVHMLTGTTQPFELNLYQDNVIYSEWKTGANTNSFIMGLSELPVKIASILKSVIISAALISAGYVAGADPTPQLKAALANAYAIIPACIAFCGFIFLKFFYKLTPEKIDQMKKEIEQRQ